MTGDVRDQLLRLLEGDQALPRLCAYYGGPGHDGQFEGRFYDTWACPGLSVGGADVFTAEDVIAVSFLSVRVPAAAARAILEPGLDNPFNALLRQTPKQQFFWVTAPVSSSPQWKLEAALMGLNRVGLTTASKLMARKRPLLVPIFDSVVKEELGLGKPFWKPLSTALADGTVVTRLRELDAEARDKNVRIPVGLSPLRLMDVAVWMAGKGNDGCPQAGD